MQRRRGAVNAAPVGRARRVAALATGLLCALGACSANAPRAVTPGTSATVNGSATSSVERFLPLQHDSVFSYDVWLPGQEAPEVLILEVERRSAERGSLKTGNVIRRVAFEADGVRLVSGGYLLKAPLTLGASWAGPAGSVRVTEVDQRIQVAAGTFSGCIETTETAGGGELRRVIVTSYCPDVGIARFSVDSASEQQRFELKAFGPRVDIGKL